MGDDIVVGNSFWLPIHHHVLFDLGDLHMSWETVSVEYTDQKLVSMLAADEETPLNPYRSGYGAKIPTRYRIKYGSTPHEIISWRRVYVMNYGNAGSPYIVYRGDWIFLDSDTQSRLEALS